MVDDGYLVGYEDGSGNFVEVGRFNNTSENVSDPLIIQHSDSGQSIELGPSGFSTESVSTGELLLGASSIERIEYGKEDFTPPGAAASDGWDDFTTTTISVSFTETWPNAPSAAFATVTEDGAGNISGEGIVAPESKTDAGVDFLYKHQATTDRSGVNAAIEWVAIL